jgi:hypothetical protein
MARYGALAGWAEQLGMPEAATSLADLVRGEFRLPSHFHAPRLGAFAAFPGPGTDQLALEFRQAA